MYPNSEIMSQEIDKLALDLSKAQIVIENAPKDKKGFGYNYTDLAGYLSVLRKPLGENNLAVTQVFAIIGGQSLLITLLLHSSGQWLKSSYPVESQMNLTKDGKKSMNDMQALGSGISYLRKYEIAAICGLAQEDDDGASVKPAVYTPKNVNEPRNFNPAIYVQSKLVPIDIDARIASEAISTFKKLCRDNSVDLAEFAKFHKIESKNIDSVTNAIENFDLLKNTFNKRNDLYNTDNLSFSAHVGDNNEIIADIKNGQLIHSSKKQL